MDQRGKCDSYGLNHFDCDSQDLLKSSLYHCGSERCCDKLLDCTIKAVVDRRVTPLWCWSWGVLRDFGGLLETTGSYHHEGWGMPLEVIGSNHHDGCGVLLEVIGSYHHDGWGALLEIVGSYHHGGGAQGVAGASEVVPLYTIELPDVVADGVVDTIQVGETTCVKPPPWWRDGERERQRQGERGRWVDQAPFLGTKISLQLNFDPDPYSGNIEFWGKFLHWKHF